jgi:hypothetical protein
MTTLTPRQKAVVPPPSPAVDLFVEALAMIEALTDYAHHLPTCHHPHGCDCGLAELFVKARHFHERI